jgi:hypothetical protein
MARQRQVGRAVALALVTLALGAGPAWAIPPSVGTIVLQPGKLGVSTSTGAVSAPGLVKWRPGASDTAGVGCCTYRISGRPRPFDTTTATSFPVKLHTAADYAYRIDGYDAAGTYLGKTLAPPFTYVTMMGVLGDDSAAYTTTGWSRKSVPGALDGDVHRTTSQFATATFGPIYGSSFGVVVQKGPTAGVAEFALDGSRVSAIIDLYSPTVQNRQIVFVASPNRAGGDVSHVLSVQLSPGNNPAGATLSLDGLVYLTSD